MGEVQDHGRYPFEGGPPEGKELRKEVEGAQMITCYHESSKDNATP